MAKTVRAKQRGYIGKVLREQGEEFTWPEGIKLGSWVDPVRFGGKGDHDGNGLDGGAAGTILGGGVAATSITIPADWRNLPAKDRKALADQINGSGKVANAADADAVIEKYAEDNKPEVFGEAPAPQTVQEGIKDAGGGPAPDWVAPGVDASGNQAPVQADDE